MHISRRHVLAGAAAVSDDYVITTAVAKLDAPWTGITWDGRHPSSPCAVWWEDRMHALLWKRVGDQWACLGPIVYPARPMTDYGGVPGLETYVQAVPAWHLDYALTEDETDTRED